MSKIDPVVLKLLTLEQLIDYSYIDEDLANKITEYGEQQYGLGYEEGEQNAELFM